MDVYLCREEIELIRDLATKAIRQRIFPENNLFELEKYMNQILEEMDDA